MSRELGVLYFVDGNPAFREMLELSVASVRRFHPDLPIEVMERPCNPVPLWKHAYRFASFWKWRERAARQNQDWRIIFAKAGGMLATPFEHTLYLDADTVLLRPLDGLIERALQCDVMATPLGWKHYRGFRDSHPTTYPMVMAGVVFYSRRFSELYRPWVEELAPGAGVHFAGDQYMFSMACHMEAQRLDIRYEPDLQIDAVNLEQHLGTPDYPRIGEVIDLACPELERFRIFHFNGPHKREYMHQIRCLAATARAAEVAG